MTFLKDACAQLEPGIQKKQMEMGEWAEGWPALDHNHGAIH
jgi:hypothetical protein